MPTQPQPHILHPHPLLPPMEEPTREAPRPTGRGLAAALIAVSLGLLMTFADGGRVTWGDGAVLGMVVVGAMVGGAAAERIVARRPLPVGQDGWMTVVVTSCGPSETSEVMARPSPSPRPRPERRQLDRLARGRRRELMDSSLR